jgi:hypothetical protein
MYMTGFASVTSQNAGCIALFFSEWALDTVIDCACSPLLVISFLVNVGHAQRCHATVAV